MPFMLGVKGASFLTVLDEACQRNGWIVLAYVLMGNCPVCDYNHLNPSRARMIGKGKTWETLKEYPWCSLSYYCSWESKRPEWLTKHTLAHRKWVATTLIMGQSKLSDSS